MKIKIYKLLKFIGRKSLVWLLINMISGVALAVMEMAFSLVMILLLKSIGVVKDASVMPFNLGHFNFSPQIFMVGLIGLGVFRGLAQFFVGHSANVANEMIGLRLNLLLIYETFKLKRGFLSSAEIYTKMGDVFPKATSFCFHSAMIIPSGIQAIILFGIMISKAFRETVIGMLGVVAAGFLVHLGNKVVRKLAREMPHEHYQKNIRLSRAIKNYFLLKALRTLSVEHDAMVRGYLSISNLMMRSYFFTALLSIFPNVIGVFIIGILISVHLSSPILTGVEFLSFLYLFLRLVQTFSGLSTYVGALSINYLGFRSAVKYFFGFSPEIINTALAPAVALSPFGSSWEKHLVRIVKPEKIFNGSFAKQEPPKVEFKDVSFQYDSDGPLVISHFNMLVEPGTQAAIIGSSGAGKSTVLALTLGLIKPTDGAIEIDRQSPEDYYLMTASRVGYVGAEPFLIEGNLRENILYGRNEAFTDADIWEALDAARLGDWLRTTKDRLNLKISENGEGLSTGQKQRLSLARALMAQPSLLILDEISANLDLETELQIANTIESLDGKCTTLIVSHREGLVKHVKNKVVLKNKG